MTTLGRNPLIVSKHHSRAKKLALLVKLKSQERVSS